MINKIFGGLGLLVVAGLIAWFFIPENPLKTWLGNTSLLASNGANEQGGRAQGGQTGGQNNGQNNGSANGQPAGSSQRRAGAQNAGSGRPSGRGRGPREALVVTRPVRMAISGDRLTSIGDGEASASVTIVPRDAGVLTEVVVKSGDQVSEGDLLARLDSETEEIARDLSQRGVEDATIAQQRIAKLVRSRAGSQADLDQANNALARAKLALRDAELKLTQRQITAPISGAVGIISVTRGSRVTTSTEIVTIDDRSRLLINFRVPERFASRIRVGQEVEATSFAVNGMQKGAVVGVGNRVDTNSRTLPVQAEIDNSNDQLRTGMAFSVTLRFKGEQFPAVDPLAVQWDSNGSFVWTVADQKAKRTDIRIVQRNTDSVLVQGKLTEADKVVVEGVMSLRNGGAVRIAGGDGGGKKPRQRTGDGKTGNGKAGNGKAGNGKAGNGSASPAQGKRQKPIGDNT